MARRLIARDPVTGTSCWFEDNLDGSFAIVNEQDCADTIEFVGDKTVQAPDMKGDMVYIGSIPMLTYHRLRQQGIMDDPKALRRWALDNSKFLPRRRLL